MSETEMLFKVAAEWEARAKAAEAERDSLKRSMLGGEVIRTLESRIESLVGEREELRDGLRVLTTSVIRHEHQCCIGLLEPVLSSRAKPTSSDGADTNSKAGSLGETTDSPTCPTCGADLLLKTFPRLSPLLDRDTP